MRRFASFPAIRHRGKVRTIGLQHEMIIGSRCQSVAHRLGILEGENARETDQRTELDDTVHFVPRARKAVEHTANRTGEWFQLCEGCLKTVALVNDAIEAE